MASYLTLKESCFQVHQDPLRWRIKFCYARLRSVKVFFALLRFPRSITLFQDLASNRHNRGKLLTVKNVVTILTIITIPLRSLAITTIQIYETRILLVLSTIKKYRGARRFIVSVFLFLRFATLSCALSTFCYEANTTLVKICHDFNKVL